MKYLKKFNQHLNYSNYLTNNSYNQIINEDKDDIVSYCLNENEVHYDISPFINGHEYIEIGGKKWATMNIGATSVTDYGFYFQWGDTQGYTASQVGSGEGQKYFGWEDYKYGNGTSSPGDTGMTKYNSIDGKTVLEASDDAAAASWGGQWRMPTKDEYVALGNAVNTAWTTNYLESGVNGLLCTDKTDSSKVLFFPACSLYLNDIVYGVGRYCYYWSSSLSSSNIQKAFILYFFDGGNINWQENGYRYSGLPVRAVAD